MLIRVGYDIHFDLSLIHISSAPVPSVPAATNLLLLRAGEIYFQGTPEKFLETNDPYLKQFLASAE